MDTPLNRSNITQELNLTKFTDDEEESRLDAGQFEEFLASNNAFLRLLYEGADRMAEQRFDEAAAAFARCMELLREGGEPASSANYNSAVLHCNIALCRFHQNDLTETERSLNRAKAALGYAPGMRSEGGQALYLKILCNYCVLYTKTRHFDNVQKILKMINDFVRLQPDAQLRAGLVSQVIYALFRAESLGAYLPAGECPAQRSAASYGIYLMIAGLNAQAAGQGERASAELFKALEHWKNAGDEVMCLVVLRHLQQLYLDVPATLDKLQVYFRAQLKESGLEEQAFEELFADFEVKLRVVREIAKCLQSLEQLSLPHAEAARQPEGLPLTKLALRLSIRASMRAARVMAARGKDAEGAAQLRESIKYMERTLLLLEEEGSPAMLALLGKHPFVHSSINRLKAGLAGMLSGIHRHVYRHPFDRLRAASAARPALPRRVQLPPVAPAVLSRRAREAVNAGDYLTKLNFTSNGCLRKFFRVFNSQTLRWAKKPALLAHLRSCHSYALQEVRGVLYGKCTPTFNRPKNAAYEPWLCFSLVLQKRPLDIYCEEEKLNAWMIGLSEYVRQHNPRAFTLSKGKFLWRKFALVIKYVVLAQVPEKMKAKLRKSFSLAKAIILYGVLMSNAQRRAGA